MDHKKLALIHIIKKELSLSDQAYRDMLDEAVGVRSAKDLTPEQFKTLMNYFMRTKHYRPHGGAMTLRQKMYIKHLSEDIGWDERHLNNFIRKYYHEGSLEQLSKTEASHVIESLKNIEAHERRMND